MQYTQTHTLTQLYAHKHVTSAEKSLRIVETLTAQKEKMNDDSVSTFLTGIANK
jgi:hypothetical protein